jgi:hypothetical protein
MMSRQVDSFVADLIVNDDEIVRLEAYVCLEFFLTNFENSDLFTLHGMSINNQLVYNTELK